MAKYTSKGTVLQIDIATVFTSVAQVRNITAPSADVQDFECPDLNQTAAGIGHAVTGYTEPGQVSFDGFFDPVAASHTELTDLLTTPAERDYKILWSDSATTAWPFSAILKSFTPKAAVGEPLTFDAGLQLTDLATYP